MEMLRTVGPSPTVGRTVPVVTMKNLPILYHYTTLDAFKAIISSGKIRATHYRHLSRDEQELLFGVEKLLEAVNRLDVDDSQREYKQYLICFIELFKSEELEVYVLSLSENEDSPHHWQSYAPSGVAIGFCPVRVRNGFPIDITQRVGGEKVENPVRSDPANRFMRCRYIDTLDLPTLVAERFFAPNSYPAIFDKPMMERWINPLLAVSIYQTICSIKREGFVPDVECRCVHIDPDQNEYPVKPDEKGRPFIEMQFDPSEFVKEVWVGPHAKHLVCEASIASFLETGRLHCELKNSAGSHNLPAKKAVSEPSET